MRLWTPKVRGHQWSLHTFRWGFHFKFREDRTFRHFIVKARRSNAWGQTHNGVNLWIGWFKSVEGVRKGANGYRLRCEIARMKNLHPSPTMDVPIYPNNPNTRRSFDDA